MPRGDTHLEEVSDLAPLEREWDELATATEASPFVRPGWIDAWWRAFGAGRLTVLVLRRGGRLVGVLPLARRHRALVSPTNWHTPEFAPIAADADALAELLRGALGRSGVRLDLSFLYRGSAAAEACARAAEANGSSSLTREIQHSPYLHVDEDWTSFQSRLPARRTAKYRRFRRRLEEQGQVVIESLDGRMQLRERLREGLEIEAESLRGRQGTPILARPATARFYTEVAEWAAARDWLRLWFMRLDGAPIAFAYGLECDGVYFDLKLGFDPAYGRFGPGVLLMEARIRHAFTAPLKRFEFLGASERHKLDWTDDVHVKQRVQIFPPTIGGALNRLAWERGRPLIKRLVHRG